MAKSSNPAWNRDELILALDLYMKHRPSAPAKGSAEITGLSVVLNALQAKLNPGGSSATLRNANGVYMKLMNFKSADPDVVAAGRKGLKAGNSLEPLIWSEFAGDPERLRLTASAIREALSFPDGTGTTTVAPPEIDSDFEAPEGRILTRLHVSRERNRKLVESRKSLAMKEAGRLACEACGFDFSKVYGPRGDGFIECHHTKPVHLLGADGKTHIRDLALLCSNCHRMIHARAPWLSIAELKHLLSAQAKSQ